MLQAACYNTSMGAFAGANITTGNFNDTIGRSSGSSITTGCRNAIFGADSANLLTTGCQNVAIGDNGDLGRILTLTTQDNRGIFGHNQITNAYVKVAWTVTSDARDKMNFESVPHGLDFVIN
jgi:trimeric autotransporter adhesin